MARPPEISLSAAILFGPEEWQEEVTRYEQGADARVAAERARREVESGKKELVWRPCEAAGADGTSLPGCRKLYVPFDRQGSSAAPYGLIFQLIKIKDRLAWNFIAFGERHPDNERTRSVYERAHKRLHGRYP